MAKSSKRFYLVCKKSIFGGWKLLGGFWSLEKASKFADTQAGKVTILRQVDDNALEEVEPKAESEKTE